MKTLAFVLLAISHSAFALSGVIESKILGSKNLSIEFSAVKAVPVEMQVEVLTDNDTQDKTCVNSLNFRNIAQAIYTLSGVRTQESLDITHDVSDESVSSESECVKVATGNMSQLPLFLQKGGYPQFVVSQRHTENGLVQRLLLLSIPRQIGIADLLKVTPEFYTLQNIELVSKITVNYSVVDVQDASWSYLEHGTVVLNSKDQE